MLNVIDEYQQYQAKYKCVYQGLILIEKIQKWNKMRGEIDNPR